MVSRWEHLQVAKQTKVALQQAILEIDPKRSVDWYDKDYLSEVLHTLNPCHPWFRVPLRASVAWEMPLEALKPIAEQHGISSKSKTALLTQLFAKAPQLTIFDGATLSKTPAEIEHEIEALLCKPWINRGSAKWLRANLSTLFPHSLMLSRLLTTLNDYEDKHRFEAVYQVLRLERQLYGEYAAQLHLKEELKLAQADWDKMATEGIVQEA